MFEAGAPLIVLPLNRPGKIDGGAIAIAPSCCIGAIASPVPSLCSGSLRSLTVASEYSSPSTVEEERPVEKRRRLTAPIPSIRIGDDHELRRISRLGAGRLFSTNVLQKANPEFMHKLLTWVKIHFETSREIFATAMVYLELFLQRRPSARRSMTRATSRRVLTMMLISSKWIDDDCLHNIDWAQRFGIPLLTLNSLERTAIDVLTFDLAISSAEFEFSLSRIVPVLSQMATTGSPAGRC